MEGAKVGPDDLRISQDLVEIGPHHVAAAGPLEEPTVAPEDDVVAGQQHDAVGHALQDAFILQEAADVDDGRKMVGVGVDADVVAIGQLGHGAGGGRHLDDLELAAQPVAKRNLLVVSSAEAENLRHA